MIVCFNVTKMMFDLLLYIYPNKAIWTVLVVQIKVILIGDGNQVVFYQDCLNLDDLNKWKKAIITVITTLNIIWTALAVQIKVI